MFSILYTMISNYDLEDMAHFYKIDIVVVMKDELIKIKPISGNYIINLESSKDGNGTHWMGLKIENFDCVYFDSYGYLPPQEIINFCKRIHNSHLAYNTKEIQNLSTTTCGFCSCILKTKLYLTFSLDLLHFLIYFMIIQNTIIKIYNCFIENYQILQNYKFLEDYIIKNNEMLC